jgi:hypothetical protein
MEKKLKLKVSPIDLLSVFGDHFFGYASRVTRQILFMTVQRQDLHRGCADHVGSDAARVGGEEAGSSFTPSTPTTSHNLVFRKYVLTQRVFDHQDWSNPWWAVRARTLSTRGSTSVSQSA